MLEEQARDPYTFLAADALTMKVREGGRVVNTHVLVASGVNADGHREILGLDVCSAESEAGWLTLFRGLNARGLVHDPFDLHRQPPTHLLGGVRESARPTGH